MESRTGMLTHADGEVQRYELLKGVSWKSLSYQYMHTCAESVRALVRLYTANIIVKNPGLYGTMVFSHVPADMKIPFERATDAGYLYDDQALTRYHFTRMAGSGEIRADGEHLFCHDTDVHDFFSVLQKKGFLHIVEGMKGELTYVPICDTFGFLSQETSADTAVNSHFFLMDPTDIDSPYDSLGTPYGFAVERKEILQPPLFDREALIVDSQERAFIKHPSLRETTIHISGTRYHDGEDGVTLYSRPGYRITPERSGTDLVVVNRRIVAVSHGGGIRIPMAGFVLHSDSPIAITENAVHYSREDDIIFAVQVGPSAVIDGQLSRELTCPFYRGEGTPFPSTVYPLPYETARASRTAIGEQGGKPVILWLEGASKNGHVPFHESSGSSLLETAEIAGALKINSMVNMDGGGSAQIHHQGKRELLIADRDVTTNTIKERPVPLGLVIRG
ncbi:MAG: phosphodiester glycosidase family protein [Sphaerochaetaceae bacterium]|nr:phosphodiester glycosidase family protein [Sphaerochaetaceae bacterium]